MHYGKPELSYKSTRKYQRVMCEILQDTCFCTLEQNVICSLDRDTDEMIWIPHDIVPCDCKY